MSGRSTPTSPHTVLPPIITNDKDREFLKDVHNCIAIELNKVDQSDHEQRYTVFKAAFDKIIDYVSAYKPLLTAVKAEYEDCIDTIQRGQREAFFLTGKLKAMASEPSTIRNYKKRGDELEQRLAIIRTDNMRLQKQLADLRSDRAERERKAKEINEPPKRVVKKDRRAIPGLTLQQSTDIKILTAELIKLDRQLKELNISHRTRYSPKDVKVTLKEQLAEKVATRDLLTEKTELMKAKRQKLKVAVEAAQAYMKIQPPHQTIGEAVVASLTRAKHQLGKIAPGEDNARPAGTPSTTFEEDDPSKEKEAEMMLEYIEKFNELLEDGKYEEAAIHAANSPKGILRTPETMNRFKELVIPVHSRGRSPLLAFCDALMSTVLAYGVRPSEYMSQECVKCALEENRLDLLSHWIAQNRLTMTNELGQMIYEFCERNPKSARQCLALAQRVFMETEDHIPALICMVRQGRVNQALEYAQRFRLDHYDYITVLQAVPSPQLAAALYQATEHRKQLLPLGVIVTTLLETESYKVGLHLLQGIYLQGLSEEDNSHPLRKAVFDDQISSHDQWIEIVQKCHENEYKDAGLEILTAVTVLSCLKNAAKYAQVYENWEDQVNPAAEGEEEGEGPKENSEGKEEAESTLESDSEVTSGRQGDNEDDDTDMN